MAAFQILLVFFWPTLYVKVFIMLDFRALVQILRKSFKQFRTFQHTATISKVIELSSYRISYFKMQMTTDLRQHFEIPKSC